MVARRHGAAYRRLGFLRSRRPCLLGGSKRPSIASRFCRIVTAASPRIACAGSALLAALIIQGLPASSDDDPAQAALLARQAAEYRAETAKTIIELQQFRRADSIDVEGVGGRRGKATLVNLNPRINAWFLLMLDWGQSSPRQSFHLENPNPRGQVVRLSVADTHGVQISLGDRSVDCALWSSGAVSPLEAAQRSAQAYAPLCDGRLYLRNRVHGHSTNLERMTDFLRDYVWGGEEVIGFVKKEFYSDQFMEQGTAGASAATAAGSPSNPDWPLPASLDAGKSESFVVPQQLGIDLGQPASGLAVGRWYPVKGLAGVYVSLLQPQLVSSAILKSYRGRVNNFDSVEGAALVYLVAFDLSAFDLGFALGTDHPRVGWSDRPSSAARGTLPGPDGINTAAPLVTNGMISPPLVARTIATFTGGFKREHGAFRYGRFAEGNHGSHYGFVEQGTVFSKLLPGLSTLYVLDDGMVDMKTWTDQDDDLLPRIKHARQNGVPLIEHDPATNGSVPGPLVAQWGPGNWSGSADEKLRSLRAGACLQETPTRRFLIYGYFSTATPSVMARVFQAYGCRYAMHLDMNALEHTYLALYLWTSAQFRVEYLIQGMAQVDSKGGRNLLPRFLGYSDDRDFFYLYRRERTP
jgi:hypothetical protein